MIRKALKSISYISNDDDVNTKNYIESINYIDNLYHVISRLKRCISVKKIKFLPSFKGKYICEKLGITSEPLENELKIIKVSSDKFRIDKETTKIITDLMNEICTEIILIDDTFIFKLQ